MKKLYLLVFLLSAFISNAQSVINNPFQQEMDAAYQENPTVPKGILEAVSFVTTHFSNITDANPESCFGLPHVYGVMGLTADGQGYFKNNLSMVARLSGYSINDVKNNPQINILAYATAFAYLIDSLQISSLENQIKIIEILSEIPLDNNVVNNYALDCHAYSIYSFLNKTSNQQAYNFPNYSINLEQVFGASNLAILSSSKNTFGHDGIVTPSGLQYTVPTMRTAEYGPALWVATPTCNYSSRNGTPVSAITIHTIQGSYAGAISWAQNCSANVSYHYVLRSSDGQVTQMLLEADKGWHVGSENPYTIGYEHDGYVGDSTWNTTAIYNSSANLSRDITQSGYGISPLRTFFGAATVGLNTLGACTRIKGHQHYPNQSHLDPGVTWDWERYYKLINNNPTYITYTAGSGNLYDSGGALGNYSNNERTLYLIQPSNSGSVTITFNSFDIEANWDYLFIYDGATPNTPLIGKYTGTTSPVTVSSTGGSLLLEFRSDCATTAPGWAITYTSVQVDNTPPTTSISTAGTWKTTDFTANFSDADNIAVTEAYYQVADFDGTEWRSNPSFGFFNDDFNQAALHSDWVTLLGTWNTTSANLQQIDETESNSNLYANLTQGGANTYIYNWQGQINGAGTNRRAGLHFFSDDATQNNRGNSYLVYWRVDSDNCQIYKITGNTITLMTNNNVVVDPNITYDFKIVYNPFSGEIKAFLDNNLVSSWVDPTPLTTGNFISPRTGNCIGIYDNLRVYKSRTLSELVTIGSPSSEIRYQNSNTTTPAGRIASLNIDGSNNWSTVDEKLEDIDWTTPSNPVISDGIATDIDTFYVNTEISANWSLSTDSHSGVQEYQVAVGTTLGGSDIVSWTTNSTNTSITQTGLSLTYNTMYYVSVKSINGASLESVIISSNGQYLLSPTQPPVANFAIQSTTICQNDSVQLVNSSSNATSFNWSIPGANPSTSALMNPNVVFPTSGNYSIVLTATSTGGTDVSNQTISISVITVPVAIATPVEDTIYLPNTIVTFTNNSTDATSYNWDFDNGSSSTDTNPWATFNSAGTYNVSLIASNIACGNDTTITPITVLNPTGITEYDFRAGLYPNPTNGIIYLNIDAQFDETLSIYLYALSGKLVTTFPIKSVVSGRNSLQFDLNSYGIVTGYYFLTIEGKNNNTTLPIIYNK